MKFLLSVLISETPGTRRKELTSIYFLKLKRIQWLNRPSPTSASQAGPAGAGQEKIWTAQGAVDEVFYHTRIEVVTRVLILSAFALNRVSHRFGHNLRRHTSTRPLVLLNFAAESFASVNQDSIINAEGGSRRSRSASGWTNYRQDKLSSFIPSPPR